MATIRKRGARWQVQVRRQGYTHLKPETVAKKLADLSGG